MMKSIESRYCDRWQVCEQADRCRVHRIPQPCLCSVDCQIHKSSPEPKLIPVEWAQIDPSKRWIADRLIFDSLRLREAAKGHRHEIGVLSIQDFFQQIDIWNHAEQELIRV